MYVPASYQAHLKLQRKNSMNRITGVATTYNLQSPLGALAKITKLIQQTKDETQIVSRASTARGLVPLSLTTGSHMNVKIVFAFSCSLKDVYSVGKGDIIQSLHSVYIQSELIKTYIYNLYFCKGFTGVSMLRVSVPTYFTCITKLERSYIQNAKCHFLVSATKRPHVSLCRYFTVMPFPCRVQIIVKQPQWRQQCVVIVDAKAA